MKERNGRGSGLMSLQPSALCRNIDHRAGFKVLGVMLARLPGHIDMGTRLLR